MLGAAVTPNLPLELGHFITRCQTLQLSRCGSGFPGYIGYNFTNNLYERQGKFILQATHQLHILNHDLKAPARRPADNELVLQVWLIGIRQGTFTHNLARL